MQNLGGGQSGSCERARIKVSDIKQIFILLFLTIKSMIFTSNHNSILAKFLLRHYSIYFHFFPEQISETKYLKRTTSQFCKVAYCFVLQNAICSILLIFCLVYDDQMSRQQDKSKDQTGFSPILHPAPNIIDIPTFDIRQSPDSPGSQFFEKFNRPDYQTFSAFRLVKHQNGNSASSASKKQGVARKHRGNYRKYTVSEKQQAVKQILEGVDAKEISQKYGIPRRNLLRWKKNGCERKEGGGRPTDGEMQLTLYTKIDGKILLNEKDIRAEAKRLSKMSDFKASKGWYCKFSRRFNQWKKQERERILKQQGRDALLDDKDVFLLPEVSGDSDDYSDSDLSGSTPAKKQE